MINTRQLLTLVILPTLQKMGDVFLSEGAIQLLLGTCAHESQMGTYLKQIPNGPALGIYQMEPATYKDLAERYKNSKRVNLFSVLRWMHCDNIPDPEALIYNLRLATLFARLKYFDAPEKIPDKLPDIAHYWKKYYNTWKGAGTAEQFLEHYRQYITN